MSRYVDLYGLSWDGEPITSKIQEVKTKIGYMSAITTGWLYGDNVPHIDLAEHDAEIRRQTLSEFRARINEYLIYSEWHGLVVTDDAINCVINQMKEVRNETNLDIE